MAVLFITGFDAYGSANSNTTAVASLLTAGEWTTAAGNGYSITAPLSATGQALNLTGGSSILTRTLGGNYARLIGGLRFSAGLTAIVGIQFSDAGTAQAAIAINTTGTIAVRNGAVSSGTILATSTAGVTANTTHYLEWDITFANAGTFVVYLDGVAIIGGSSGITGSGDTTATANAYATQIALQITGTGSLTVDDFYLFDATGGTNNAVLLNSPRVETTIPTADSAVQFAVGSAILGSSVARTTTTFTATANFMFLYPLTPAVNCTINSVGVLPQAASGAAQLRGLIYADGGTVPGTLMSSSLAVTGTTVGAPKTMALQVPQSLTAGTRYWLGFMIDTNVAMAQLDAANNGYRAAATFASGAPSTAPGMTTGVATPLVWGVLSAAVGNWAETAQRPPESGSFVFDATVGHEDLYAMSPLATTPALVHAVAVKAFASRSDSGAKTVSLRIKSGSTDSGGSATGQTPGTSFGWLASYFPTDPNTGSPWTGANLDAATAGFRVDS